MKIIYQTKYLTETFAEGNKAAEATAPEIEKALAECWNTPSEDFLLLALLCNQLAAHVDAEIKIGVDAEENTATVFLTAPCFVFRVRQFLLLQKITMRASEIVFDITEKENSQITVIFDFKKTNELLSSQYESALASLKK